MDYKVLKDQYGAVGQPYKGGFEGGDSASWSGIYYYLTKRTTFIYSRFFQVKPGAYVRHPIKNGTYNMYGSYYKNPWDGNMSRDQLTGVMAGLINDNILVEKLKFSFHSLLRLFIFAYNNRENGVDPEKGSWRFPDLLGPASIATHIRMYKYLAIILNPILHILDIHLVLSTLIINKTEKDDCNNYFLRLQIARDISPTLTSRYAVSILDKKHLVGRLFHYWCFWRKQPGMYRLLQDKIKVLK